MKNTNSIQILILVGLFAFSLQAVGQESEYQTTLEDIVEVQKRVEKGEKFGRATREMSFIRIASKQEERKKWYLRQEPNAKDKKKLDEALDALAKAFVKHGGTAKEYEWD